MPCSAATAASGWWPGRFRYVNPGFAAIFGYGSPEDLVDRVPVADLVAPGDRQRVADNVQKRIAGEVTDMHYSFRGLRRDGSQIDVEVHGRRTPFDLMPPEEAERVRGQFAEIASRGLPFRDLDNINRHKDGSLRHVQTNGMPVFDAAGSLLGYRGLDRDVTEKRRAELALLETSNRLRALVRTIPDLVWLKDPQGVYLACNPRCAADHQDPYLWQRGRTHRCARHRPRHHRAQAGRGGPAAAG